MNKGLEAAGYAVGLLGGFFAIRSFLSPDPNKEVLVSLARIEHHLGTTPEPSPTEGLLPNASVDYRTIA
jgi:hypothetical protein